MTAKYFDVHYGESQWGRQIEAKLKANDIEDVIQWIKETYTAYEYTDSDIQDNDSAYLMINPCTLCDLNQHDKPLEDNPCENCETSMCFDIHSTNDIEDSLILIFASHHTKPQGPMKHDAYHDLTQ